MMCGDGGCGVAMYLGIRPTVGVGDPCSDGDSDYVDGPCPRITDHDAARSLLLLL